MIIPNLGIIKPNMGMLEAPLAGLAAALFSRTQLRVLSLLIGNPNRSFHAAEIIRLARSGSGAVQREIEKLTKAGIVDALPSGNRKLYQANRHSPIFDELYNIVTKTVGVVEPIREALQPFQSKIALAFVYGSVARGTDTAKSDIDLLVLGQELSYGEIFSALQPVEKQISRPINPSLMTVAEWRQKLAAKNGFVTSILRQPKFLVIGAEHELQRIG